MAGIVTVNGRVTSGTRTGAVSWRMSMAVPSGATSWTRTNTTSIPAGPVSWPAADAGALTVTVSFGDPTTASGWARDDELQVANVPGASCSGSGAGRKLPTASSGLIDVAAPAAGVRKDWLPATVGLAVVSWLPPRYHVLPLPTGNDFVSAYAGAALP